jgi:uncharacterized repeat protein (TIGR03847 family)
MPPTEIELDPVDFVTVGTVGPKGRRLFHLQAGKNDHLITLTIEKEQARALAEAIGEMLNALNDKFPDLPKEETILARLDMSLRDPLEAMFRVAQMGLGYDEIRDMVVLVAQELVAVEEDEEEPSREPQVIRLWATREQMRALSDHTLTIVKQGRADPKSNGHLIYYWT